MDIVVNGTSRAVPAGCTVAQLLATLQLDPRYLAVERNGQIVPRGQHADCQLEPGDQIEIVTLVGGG